ncbi:MAG: PPA1309 family protein [Scrofimicrobium sp.]
MSEIEDGTQEAPQRRNQMEERSGPSSSLAALRRVIDELEVGSARVGWDRPPALYALVRTEHLLSTPGLPSDVAESLRAEWDGSPEHLSAVAQETVPQDDLEELLPKIAWPETVAGAALTVERIILPDDADEDAPEDPDEAVHYAENHPARTDIRVVVGVSRDGDSWCEVRARTFDDRERVGQGPKLVPALVEGLRIGLTEES